jgi:hypothetical protein
MWVHDKDLSGGGQLFSMPKSQRRARQPTTLTCMKKGRIGGLLESVLNAGLTAVL